MIRTPAKPRERSVDVIGTHTLGHLGELLASLGLARPLLVTDLGLARTAWPDEAAASMRAAGLRVTRWTTVHGTPTPGSVERGRQQAEGGSHDAIVAVGGGSVIDTAKAISAVVAHGGSILDHVGAGPLQLAGPPVIAVPTTPSSGAEVSFHTVVTSGAHRHAVRGPYLRPAALVADLRTWSSAPVPVFAGAIADAWVHAVEGYLGRAATTATDRVAIEAASTIHWMGGQIGPELARACLAAGRVMAEVNAGLVHALGYPMSTAFGVPHGLANASVAAAALGWTEQRAPVRCRRLAEACGTAELARAATELWRRLGIDPSPPEQALARPDPARLAHLAVGYQPLLDNAPVPVDRADLESLYDLVLTGVAGP